MSREEHPSYGERDHIVDRGKSVRKAERVQRVIHALTDQIHREPVMVSDHFQHDPEPESWSRLFPLDDWTSYDRSGNDVT